MSALPEFSKKEDKFSYRYAHSGQKKVMESSGFFSGFIRNALRSFLLHNKDKPRSAGSFGNKVLGLISPRVDGMR
jgi:hypothetical protein